MFREPEGDYQAGVGPYGVNVATASFRRDAFAQRSGHGELVSHVNRGLAFRLRGSELSSLSEPPLRT
jgi:hypothetical protein